MDGNGRWAASRGLPVAEGHREGARALRRTVEAAIELGIESLELYLETKSVIVSTSPKPFNPFGL